MNTILNAVIPEDAIGVWWLGQSGFIMKNSKNVTVCVDPYLSDSAGRRKESSKRMVPVPIEPEDLVADVFCCTHDHTDHFDPETVSRYAARGRTVFVGPRSVCRHFEELGIPADQTVLINAGDEKEIEGIKVRGTFALATDYDSLDGIGFLYTFGNGKKICVSGDTSYANLICGVARYRPDLYCVVINGGYGNLDVHEAAIVTSAIEPKTVVPTHFGMFPGNTVDPNTFPRALEAIACDVSCRIPRVLEMFLV